MTDTTCDECGTAFYGHGDHRGNYWLMDTEPNGDQTTVGRFCSKRCLAVFANRRADDAERNRSDTP